MPRTVLAVLLVCLAGWPSARAQVRTDRAVVPRTFPVVPGPAPADLTITGTSTTATLVWPAAPGSSGYRVYRSVGASGTWALLSAAPITVLRYDDRGLDYRSQYLYRVAGIFPAGEGTPVQRSFQPPAPVVPVKTLAPRTGLVIPTIGIRGMYPVGGSAIDIFFNAVPNATTYALKRGSSSSGPFTALGTGEVSLTTNNYLLNPPCCELEDLQAYKVGVGQTVWYVIEAMAGSSVIMSSAPLRMDLPSWFKGPLLVDVAKTGTDQYTIGWGAVDGATKYLVWVKLNGGTISAYYNANIPAGQTQVTISGLSSGSQYQVYVTGDFVYNGTQQYRAGTKWYTAP